MSNLIERVHRLSRMSARIGGWLFLISAFAVAAEVILRKVFVLSISGANEISGYAFAVGGTWAAAFALMERANIRIDAVYRLFPHRICTLLDFLSLLCVLGFIGFLLWRVALVLWESVEMGARSNTPLGVPLWIPQSLWLFGMAGILIVGLMLFSWSVRAYRKGDLRSVTRLIGTVGVEAEIEQELAEASGRLSIE